MVNENFRAALLAFLRHNGPSDIRKIADGVGASVPTTLLGLAALWGAGRVRKAKQSRVGAIGSLPDLYLLTDAAPAQRSFPGERIS